MSRSLLRLSVLLGLALVAPGAQAECKSHLATPAPKPPELVAGLGDATTFRISTRVKEAQAWFDQGMRLVWAFDAAEADRSFAKALELDSACAACLSGRALAQGPSLNGGRGKLDDAQLRSFALRAKTLGKDAPADEAAFIDAVAVLGEPKVTLQRWASESARIADAHPSEPTLQALAAYAFAASRPWDFWGRDGGAKPGTLETLARLDRAGRLWPKHTALHHLRIHLLEGGPEPEKGAASAVALPALAPNAGHLVHMPSHIWFRMGRWAEATTANEKAAAVDAKWVARLGPDSEWSRSYAAHTQQFLAVSALQEGRCKQAAAAAKAMVSAFKDDFVRQAMAPSGTSFLALPAVVAVRCERWADVLALPEPDEAFIGARLLWLMARGIAQARTNKVADAEKTLAQMRVVLGTVDQSARSSPVQPDWAALSITDPYLMAEVQAAQGNFAYAEAAMREAMHREEQLAYDEPPPWNLSTHYAYGRIAAAAGQHVAGRAVLEKALALRPNDPWLLQGLAKLAPGEAKYRAAAAKGWSRADKGFVPTFKVAPRAANQAKPPGPIDNRPLPAIPPAPAPKPVPAPKGKK